MNVFYEEEGDFKVGTILADNDSSLQVEAVHGKRSKVKSAVALFRFSEPLAGFMESANAAAQELDIGFVWECSPQAEFSYDTLAKEYFGHAPSAAEAAALLVCLQGAPMYFYKKGKGRYRPAPADALKAALASVERKRLQAEQQARYVAQLKRFELPEEFRPRLREMFYKPDRNTLEVKALEQAGVELRLPAVRLLERCGAIPSTHDYHFGRFLFEYFPHGVEFPQIEHATLPADLPLAEVEAFSIDDATTTEIDDAFSVTRLPEGGWRVGVHIAAPALGIAAGAKLDEQAARRLSTVYMPGHKITMLPEPVIERFSLAQGRLVPVVSLYLELGADLRLLASRTVVEQLRVAANLRHDELEDRFNEQTLAGGLAAFPYHEQLKLLWELATVLEAGRGRPESVRNLQMDYNFYVDGDRVRIVERSRGSPLDKLVSELMIHVNAHWGKRLADQGVAAIYRSQNNGKVKMSTVPAAHQGLGVSHYAWTSSPLRRYVDLINQRQLIALESGQPPPYAAGSEILLGAMRDFELAYDAYAEFQRAMERYWCLRWLLQEGVQLTAAEVIRENLVKVAHIPLITRVNSLPPLAPSSVVQLRVSDIDLLELSFHLEHQAP